MAQHAPTPGSPFPRVRSPSLQQSGSPAMPIPRISHDLEPEQDVNEAGGWSPGSDYSLSSDSQSSDSSSNASEFSSPPTLAAPQGKHVKKLVESAEDDIKYGVLMQESEERIAERKQYAERMRSIALARKATVKQLRDEMETFQESTDRRINSMEWKLKTFENKMGQDVQDVRGRLQNVGQQVQDVGTQVAEVRAETGSRIEKLERAITEKNAENYEDIIRRRTADLGRQAFYKGMVHFLDAYNHGTTTSGNRAQGTAPNVPYGQVPIPGLTTPVPSGTFTFQAPSQQAPVPGYQTYQQQAPVQAYQVPSGATYIQPPPSPFGPIFATLDQPPVLFRQSSAPYNQPPPAPQQAEIAPQVPPRPPNPFVSERDGKVDWATFWRKIADGHTVEISYRSPASGEMMTRQHKTITWDTIQRWKNTMPMYIGDLRRQADEILDQYPLQEEPSTPRSLRQAVTSGLQMLRRQESESTSPRSASTPFENIEAQGTAGSSQLGSSTSPGTPGSPASLMSTSPVAAGQETQDQYTAKIKQVEARDLLVRATDAIRAYQILKDYDLFQHIIVESWRLRDLWSEAAHPSYVRMDPPMPARWLKALDNTTTLKRYFPPHEADLISVKLVQLHGVLTRDFSSCDVYGNPIQKRRRTDKGKSGGRGRGSGSGSGKGGRGKGKGKGKMKVKDTDTLQPAAGSSRGN
ncbi:uncharacterized protein FOMMEDRAFT_145775 [Fomitiporia mediterranea MF3/22]|uniref:uncharacterized protein n=1 Tax=Fomitiporia mediterranea (strain MF3/22) TaxID=694068 RepID=UPI0004409C4B|nr:uncharacterized protein FOMMEDRAFT_145775 [Fomitiporia mediterranea MF3/22]EJD05253.1 hypothetical protein FOMMEDRAFT_145775 [Fomitiporia mediterranea MF3/22]